ncbi:hypothetical protein [Azospirillum sp. BE72]|uniref:hypothetical protein n=1 Tax=Azospirillum sp. BE72 TaxID=2817776 RepID=UPI00285FB1B2|nr:hypothetical protein [Azospirillum sp. BE72]MDR6775101.1 hypothetical protein [Azospirillum sp. BE72]
MTPPLLSIQIPALDVGSMLRSRLQEIRKTVELYGDVIELVVIVPAGSDSPETTIAAFGDTLPRLRIHRLDNPYLTLDEMLFAALPACGGLYTMGLHPVDVIDPLALGAVLRHLLADTHDLIAINCPIVTETGRTLVSRFAGTLPEKMETNGAVLVHRLGFTGLVHQISTLIFKTEPVRSVDWQSYYSLSEVYFRAAVLVEALGSRPAMLRAGNAVSVIDNPMRHSSVLSPQLIAKRLDKPKLFYWAVGIPLLVGELIRRGAVPQDYLNGLTEQFPETSYKQTDHILHKLAEQLRNWIESRDATQAVNAAALKALADVYADLPPLYLGLLAKFERLLPLIEDYTDYFSMAYRARSNIERPNPLLPLGALKAEERAGLETLMRDWLLGECGNLSSMLSEAG